MELAQRLMEAVNKSEAWVLSLEVGKTFLGASPAAIENGYAPNTPEHRIFVQFALENLKMMKIVTKFDSHQIVSLY